MKEFVILIFIILLIGVGNAEVDSGVRYIVEGVDGVKSIVENVSESELKDDKSIFDFEEDVKFYALGIQDWNYKMIRANVSEGKGFGAGVKICVLDTGVNFNLLDIENGYDFVNMDSDASDDNGHGTFVSQILRVPGSNLPLSKAEVYAVKVLDENGSGWGDDIANGIDWCVDNDVDVVLMSLGGKEESRFLELVIESGYSQGVLFVAAGGNEGDSSAVYPCAWDEVICVGSINSNLQKSGFSNFNEFIEVVAPGENIIVTDGSQDWRIDGTSIAVPHVGVVLTSILERWSNNVGAREILQEGALDLGVKGRDNDFGFGLVRILDDVIDFSIQGNLSFGVVMPGEVSEIVNSKINVSERNNKNFTLYIELTNESDSVFENIYFDLDKGGDFNSDERLGDGLSLDVFDLPDSFQVDLKSVIELPVGILAGKRHGVITYTVIEKI